MVKKRSFIKSAIVTNWMSTIIGITTFVTSTYVVLKGDCGVPIYISTVLLSVLLILLPTDQLVKEIINAFRKNKLSSTNSDSDSSPMV